MLAKTMLALALSLFDQGKGPGLAYAVIKDGKVVEQGAHGYADIEAGRKIDAKTPFNIASNSKAFTAAAILLLEREKKIAPDDLVAKHLKDWPAYAKDVKVRHLLHHTSGLPEYLDRCDRGRDRDKPMRGADVMELVRQGRELAFPLGSREEYTNTNYVVLAELVKAVTGKTLPVYMKEKIFAPLGMRDTWVLNSEVTGPAERAAASYGDWPFFPKAPPSQCDYVFGDGGVITTLEDYLKWTRAVTSPGLFTAAELKRMTTAEPKTEYGYGWLVADDFEGQTLVEHHGSWRGYRASASHYTKDQIWVVVLSNYARTSTGALRDDLYDKWR